jgi:DNA mismatch repair protein MutS2
MSQSLIHNSARVLEFDALRELLRGYASSPLGQARIAALAPSTDSTWIVEQQELTGEIREFRRVGGRFEFSGLLEVTKLVKKSRIAGAVLETTEIRDVLLVVDRAAEWREIAFHPPASMRTEWKRTRALSESVPDFTEFLRSFRNKIQPDGTLEDRASPELARIRREIEKQRRGIQESLRGYLRKLAEGGAAQEELVTIRGERFVIPVKIEQKRRVQGVVHGASSSGQTVFVEPLETIEQNNELVRLLDEEQAEIHRILLEMTRRIGEEAEGILVSAEVLSELELQFAKARFAEEYNCVAVRLSGISGRPRRTMWGQPPRLSSERSEPPPPQCPPPAAGAQFEAEGRRRDPNHRGTRRLAPPVGDHRSEHGRENRDAENGRPAGVDGAVRNSSSRRPRRDAAV